MVSINFTFMDTNMDPKPEGLVYQGIADTKDFSPNRLS